MSDIPIIFSAPMVRALLDGRKTMTRRLAWGKRHKAADLSSEQQEHYDALGYNVNAAAEWFEKPSPWQNVKPGDRLWVRETWVASADDIWTAGDVTRKRGIVPMDIIYSADGPQPHGWFSPIHMPRWASRLTLAVTATKIERLQDISEADAEAEGCEHDTWDQALAVRNYNKPDGWFCMWGGPECYTEAGVYVPHERIWRASFESLWRSLHGHDGWAANPEVVALTFAVHKANIDALARAA